MTTTSLEELQRVRPCAICGEPCDGTEGIVRIGHCCPQCIERWDNGGTIVVDRYDGFRWENAS